MSNITVKNKISTDIGWKKKIDKIISITNNT